MDNFERFDIYGILGPDQKFRIRDKTTETKQYKRKINLGRIGEVYSKLSLIDMLWRLKIMPFAHQVTETRPELIGYLERAAVQSKDRNIAEFSDEKLRFFFGWYRTGMNRAQICAILQKELQKMGRLLVM